MLLVETEVRRSLIAGLGLFSVEPIAIGTVIARWDARFCWSCTEAERLALPEIAQAVIWKYGWRSSPTAPWLVSVDNSRFLNHSFAPNTRVEVHPDCPFVSIAARDIAADEELTEDYRQFDPDFDEYGKDWCDWPRGVEGAIRAGERRYCWEGFHWDYYERTADEEIGRCPAAVREAIRRSNGD